MLRIACNPSLKGLSVFCPGIVYSTQTGKDITLDLLMPQTPEDGPARTFPLHRFSLLPEMEYLSHWQTFTIPCLLRFPTWNVFLKPLTSPLP